MPSQILSEEERRKEEELGFYIPTIDVSPWLENPDPTSIENKKIIEKVRQACISTGFFQITNHGIPAALQQKVFTGSAAFFSLPMDEKKKLDKSQSVGASNRGYEILQNQGLQEGTLPDLKEILEKGTKIGNFEGFYVGKEISASDPRVKRSAFLMGPNLWPPLAESVFKEPMAEYYDACESLALKMLSLLAATLPYGPSIFDEFISNDATASVRLLHYPPDTSNDARQLGAGAHTDFGAITLLMQDECGGLQVWNGSAKSKSELTGEEGSGEWVDVEPRKDAYVVNVGDMLEMWTSGRYKSGLHRVVNRGGKDRYSVPFFFDGNVDCVLSPLDGSGEGKKWPTVEEHMRERFTSTYGRGKEREDGKKNVNL